MACRVQIQLYLFAAQCPPCIRVSESDCYVSGSGCSTLMFSSIISPWPLAIITASQRYVMLNASISDLFFSDDFSKLNFASVFFSLCFYDSFKNIIYWLCWRMFVLHSALASFMNFINVIIFDWLTVKATCRKKCLCPSFIYDCHLSIWQLVE